ncbi:hypothetical protein ABPG74_008411 [Tetrahymena malaccensis]
MKLTRIIISGTVIVTYLLVSYLRQISQLEFQLFYSDDDTSYSEQNRRNLQQISLMTSACADQEDLTNQPYISDYQTAVTNMKNLRGSNKALDAMSKDQNWNSYLDSLPAVYVGLLIAGIIAFIIFFVESMQVFCQSCISCFKRDVEKEPYANWSIWCSVISAIVATIILFGFSIAGIQTNKTLIKSMNRGICQSLIMVNHLVSGYPQQNWQGVETIETQLRNIGNELLATQNIYLSTFQNTAFLSNLNNLQLEIQNMQTLNSNQVTLPNPNRVTPKQVQPDIIFILGSVAVLDQTKVLGSLELEYQTKTALQGNLLSKIRDSSANIGNNAATIKAAFDQGSQQVNSFKTKIENFKALVEKQMTDTQNAALFVYNGGNAIFGLLIAFGLLGLLSITLILWCKLNFVKYGVYITWCTVSILSIVSFAAAAIGYTQSVGLMENCEGLQLLATDSTQFDSLINFIGTPQLKTCFFGDGNLSSMFGLQTQFLMINEVKNDLNNIDTNASLFTSNLNTRYIYQWQNQLNSYINYSQQSVQLSSANGFMQYDLPSQSLDQLNSWSNYDYQPTNGSQNSQFSLSCGAFSRDTIVYTQSYCPASSVLCVNALPISQPCCIPLDNPTFTQQFIVNRMNLITSSCANLNTYKAQYQAFFNVLSTYVNQLNTILKSNVKPAFDQYQTDSNAFLTSSNNLYQSINTSFRQQTQKLLGMVSDPANGIQNDLQCNFLINDFKNMYQGLCRSYMVRIYNSSVILIVVSCFSLAAQVAYFFSTTRMINYIDKNRVQQFVVSKQKPIIDPEKYRSHPLHDQSYMNQSGMQPGFMKDESVMYLNPEQSVQNLPGEIELNQMNNTKPVKQGLLEDVQKRNTQSNMNKSKQNNLNPLPAPSFIAPTGQKGNDEKIVPYQPKLGQKNQANDNNNRLGSLNNQNRSIILNQNPSQNANSASISQFNNHLDDNEEDDEEDLRKMMQNNNSKFGIPAGNNVIR